MDETPEAGVDDRLETSSLKFCADCKYHVLEDNSKERESWREKGEYALMSYYADKHWCRHPSYETTDIITGKTLKNEKDCYRARGEIASCVAATCGKTAKLWEPKE